MIYINDKSNSIEIPKHNRKSIQSFNLELENVINNQVFKYENLIDKGENTLFYKFMNMDFKDLIIGEYNYKILGNNEVLETGILIFGDYKGTKIQYHRENNKNIQYERD